MLRDPVERRGGSFRTQRLRWSWLLALPFLLLATPSPGSMLGGGLIALPGLLLRSWAAGFIHKEVELATQGPYRFIRHPLYAGSFFLGLGLAAAGGRWWFLLVFAALFAWVYRRALIAEDRVLERRFGLDYTTYRARVPGFLPRPPFRAPPRAGVGSGPVPSAQAGSVHGTDAWTAPPGDPPVPPEGFRPSLYGRNREWQAVVGALVGFALLWMKMMWLG